jgi:subtilisin family serine protease
VDTGIDVSHPDFESENGLSRILYIWDQNDTSGDNPEGYNYGREWTKAQIDSGSCTAADVSGHGSHVAGSAAERERLPAASTAEWLPTRTSFSSVTILRPRLRHRRRRYILQKSVELGRPCVINLSLGYQSGNHRADDPFNASMDSLLDTYGAEGRVIVWAMGNDGDSDVHSLNVLTPMTGLSVELSMDATPMYAVFYYDSNQTVPVMLVDPSSNINIAFTTNAVSYGANTMLQVGTYPTGEKYVVVKINSTTHGTWNVVFQNIGKTISIHGYIYDNSGQNYFPSAIPRVRFQFGGAGSRAIAVRRE